MNKFLAFYAVYKRRKVTKHLSESLLKRVARLLVLLLVLVVINTSAMVYFEGMLIADALWLSTTTVTTVGYGDFSPVTAEGRIVTIITMYIFAITLLSMLIAETVDWRVFTTEKKKKGQWEWKNMSDHIQIINTPNVDTDRYLERLIKQIQMTPEFADLPVQILTRKYADGLPDKLSSLGILHHTGASEEADVFNKLHLNTAKYIIVLARDATDTLSDCLTFDILCRLKQFVSSKNGSGACGPDVCIVAEAVSDENRQRFLDHGATVVLRPVRAYPEMVVRFMASPGTEAVLEDLFQYSGINIARAEHCFDALYWKDIVAKCVAGGAGTPLAYIDESGIICTNLDPHSLYSGKGIICMVGEGKELTSLLLASCLV